MPDLTDKQRKAIKALIASIIGVVVLFFGAYFGGFAEFLTENQDEIADTVVDVIDSSEEVPVIESNETAYE